VTSDDKFIRVTVTIEIAKKLLPTYMDNLRSLLSSGSSNLESHISTTSPHANPTQMDTPNNITPSVINSTFTKQDISNAIDDAIFVINASDQLKLESKNLDTNLNGYVNPL